MHDIVIVSKSYETKFQNIQISCHYAEVRQCHVPKKRDFIFLILFYLSTSHGDIMFSVLQVMFS